MKTLLAGMVGLSLLAGAWAALESHALVRDAAKVFELVGSPRAVVDRELRRG